VFFYPPGERVRVVEVEVSTLMIYCTHSCVVVLQLRAFIWFHVHFAGICIATVCGSITYIGFF